MKNILSIPWFNRQKSASVQFMNVSVLIVDDSRTQLFAMAKMLQSAGIQTMTAENGKQGILMAKHKKPDLILMDIVMPEINGFQATRYLTKLPETSHIPIIIVSGSDQGSDRAWGMKLGARDFMQKPVNKDQLLNKIRSLLMERASSAEQTHMRMSDMVQAV